MAAYELYGGPAIVVDYETATTFDVVSEKGEFLTGITAPGLQTCADALYQRAANLPKFEIVNPESVITKNTVESMQAGLVVGQIHHSENQGAFQLPQYEGHCHRRLGQGDL